MQIFYCRLERRLEILDESAAKRQQMREMYFDEAEKKLHENVVRQMEMDKFEQVRRRETFSRRDF